MTRRLVLVHGRAQQHKNAAELKDSWLTAFKTGLAKSGLDLPIPEDQVRFPYYGDTLDDLVEGKLRDEAAAVIVRGLSRDVEQEQFILALVEDIRQKTGITESQVAEIMGREIIERGPLNWKWVQGVLAALDRFIPCASGASIALFTHDVYEYLKNSGIRETIDDGVSASMEAGVETVVVAHSLGTVVAYNVLRQRGHLCGWKVPLFVTLGSPLAVKRIRQTLKSAAPTRCPECVSQWFNAMDDRDVVALYPLNPQCFPLDPSLPCIENKEDVRNHTDNRHGISGYLYDKEVAKRIYDALVV